jgi:hypothetical protein
MKGRMDGLVLKGMTKNITRFTTVGLTRETPTGKSQIQNRETIGP